MFRRTCLIAAIAAVLSLLSPVVSFAGPGESDFIARINSARRANGRTPYAVRADLTMVARRHAARMAARGDIYHNPNLGSDVRGWRSVGENVGKGGSVSAIHQAFMNSASHRANILSRSFREVGVGTATGADGLLYVAEVFRQPYGAVIQPAPRPTRLQPVTRFPARASRTRRRPVAARPAPPRRIAPSAAQILAFRYRSAADFYAKHPSTGSMRRAVTYVATIKTLGGF